MILELVGYDTDQEGDPIDEAIRMNHIPRVGEVIVFTPTEGEAMAPEGEMYIDRRYIVRNVAHVISQGVNKENEIPTQSENKTAIIYVEPK